MSGNSESSTFTALSPCVLSEVFSVLPASEAHISSDALDGIVGVLALRFKPPGVGSASITSKNEFFKTNRVSEFGAQSN